MMFRNEIFGPMLYQGGFFLGIGFLLRFNPFLLFFIISVLFTTQSISSTPSLAWLGSISALYFFALGSIVVMVRSLFLLPGSITERLLSFSWLGAPFVALLLEHHLLPGAPFFPMILALIGGLSASHCIATLHGLFLAEPQGWLEAIISGMILIVIAVAPILFCIFIPFYFVAVSLIKKGLNSKAVF